MDAFIGTILAWPMDWAPEGWAICNGQLLQVNQNQALYSLLGVRYGGDGKNTFGVPDLRGRVPVGIGQRQGSTPPAPSYTLGQTGGNDTVGLTAANLPAHTHGLANVTGKTAATTGAITMTVSTENGQNSVAKNGDYLASPILGTDTVSLYKSGLNSNYSTTIQGGAVAYPETTVTIASGTTQPSASPTAQVDVRQPYMALNYIICVSGGIYPMKPN